MCRVIKLFSILVMISAIGQMSIAQASLNDDAADTAQHRLISVRPSQDVLPDEQIPSNPAFIGRSQSTLDEGSIRTVDENVPQSPNAVGTDEGSVRSYIKLTAPPQNERCCACSWLNPGVIAIGAMGVILITYAALYNEIWS